MTEHHLNIVLAINLMPVDTLLIVVRPCTVVLLVHHTITCSILTEVWVGSACRTAFVEIYIVDRSKLETIRQLNFSKASSVKCVSFCIVCIQFSIRDRVGTTHESTEWSYLTTTIVISYHA